MLGNQGISVHLYGFYVLHKKGVALLDVIDRIKSLSKEKGIKLSFLCEKLGLRRGYFSDCANGKDRLTDERISVIADALGTTPAYLMGETDQKEKPTGNDADGLTAEMRELLTLFDAASPEIRAAALAVLKSGGPAAGAPGAASSDQ